jgi:hypothetical protein
MTHHGTRANHRAAAAVVVDGEAVRAVVPIHVDKHLARWHDDGHTASQLDAHAGKRVHVARRSEGVAQRLALHRHGCTPRDMKDGHACNHEHTRRTHAHSGFKKGIGAAASLTAAETVTLGGTVRRDESNDATKRRQRQVCKRRAAVDDRLAPAQDTHARTHGHSHAHTRTTIAAMSTSATFFIVGYGQLATATQYQHARSRE